LHLWQPVKLLLPALSLLVCPLAYAQPQFVSDLSPVTLEQALSLSEIHSPQLRAALAAVDGAAAGVTTASAQANPSVTFGSLGRQRVIQDTAVPGMLTGFTFNQPVEWPTLRSSRIRAAEIYRQSSLHALLETRLLVRAAVKQAFYQVLRRKGEVELSRGNLQLLEDLRRRIEVQVQVGEAARLELTRADAELATARIQSQSAELRLAAALSALSSAVGISLQQRDPRGSLDPPAALPPLDALRDRVLRKHPTVALAESETRRAGAVLDNERAQRVPQPTFWADVFRQPDAAQYRFGVTMAIPLWNRREGPIGQAVAAQRQAGAVADQRRLEIGAALERAYNVYQVAGQQVDIFEAGTLREAEAAVSAAEAAFRFGERGIIEVLDAQRVLRGARLDYLNAQFDRQEALVDLEELGALDDLGGRP
jgi:cobalt-zinc-cadmium efflux system outer membrane protein